MQKIPSFIGPVVLGADEARSILGELEALRVTIEKNLSVVDGSLQIWQHFMKCGKVPDSARLDALTRALQEPTRRIRGNVAAAMERIEKLLGQCDSAPEEETAF